LYEENYLNAHPILDLMVNLVNWLLPKEKKFFLMLKDQASNVVDDSKEFKNFYKLITFSI